MNLLSGVKTSMGRNFREFKEIAKFLTSVGIDLARGQKGTFNVILKILSKTFFSFNKYHINKEVQKIWGWLLAPHTLIKQRRKSCTNTMDRVTTGPGKSWKLLEFEKCPGKSLKVLEFSKF